MTLDIKSWLDRADRVRTDDTYSYATFASDLASQLTWNGALDVATVLRAYVYGHPTGTELHRAAEPLYRRLGWEQAALIACWFRDTRNRPGQPNRRPGGWPTTTPSTYTSTRSPQ